MPPKTTKNTAGYFLPPGVTWVDLIAGSEGTLAVVLEAKLKLIPLPKEVVAGVVFFRNADEALNTVERWRPIPALNMLEYIDANSLELLRLRYPEIPVGSRAALLIERDGSDVDPFLEADFMEESWFAASTADRDRFRKFRHTLPELVNERVRLNGFKKMGTDFAVPVAEFPRYWAQCVSILEELFPSKYTAYGHIGDAHVHVNILPETEEDERRGQQWLRDEARRVLAHGGTLSAEHGLGRRKKWMLPLQYSDLSPFLQVKSQFDPEGRLNHGVLL
jgi:FAD/FMN-containing dehydrogenase